jgi:formylglycine-generating enzyme required for sulfatase activity
MSEVYKIVRGGSWYFYSSHSESSYRDRSLKENKDIGIGIRLVLEETPPNPNFISIRGGSWDSFSWHSHSATRDSDDSGRDDIGLRLVQTT